ncbi:MAG: trimeric intracellular cation channel family protein [Planctomycetes bacterium]|nr:trimeric intracellular cation channel family protein [Planctomycetota bacterium]
MLPILEHIAVISAACFGVLLARSKQMDIVGVCSVTFIVAFGGGTLRDVLLDRHPLFWVAHEHYAWTVLGLAIVGANVPRLPQGAANWLHFPDALGMGLFSVVGAGLAVEEGVSLSLASLFGVITGTFGGVMGDVVCNEVPSLFRPTTPLYASCSLFGISAFLALTHFQVADTVAQVVGVTIIVVLRMVALRKGWTLPMPKS